jgi:hypothetical protein
MDASDVSQLAEQVATLLASKTERHQWRPHWQ